MAQTSHGVPIRVAHTFQGYQLLELPPELLSLVESASAKTLHLKSEAISTEADQARPEGLAVVCSADKTFEVRQAQSSNSLYVLQPSSGTGTNLGLTAIAQCKAALELVPTQPRAIQMLTRTLPFLRGPDDLAQADGGLPKSAIQANSPFSDAEFESAWQDLCAFEQNGSAWQPSSSMKIELWNSLTSAATVSGVKVTEAFNPASLKDLVEEDGYPAEMLVALLRSLATDETAIELKIDRVRLVRWIGLTLLASAGSSGMAESVLRARWQELLPDLWEDDAQLENIEGHYKDTGLILVSTEVANTEQAANSKGSEQAKPKNKWHSRFSA